MMDKKVLILGGGIGGLTSAHHLRMLLPPEVEIIVVERRDTFYVCASNLRLISGELEDPQKEERPLSLLARKGIDWLHGEVLEIDPEGNTVRTSAGTLEADNIVIALGAEKIPDAIPGFVESAYNLYEADRAMRLREALERFEGGRIVILVCGMPYSCPGVPCEAALLSDSLCREKGIRRDVEIEIYTPEKRPVPSAGTAMGDAVLEMLKEREILYHPQQKVREIIDDPPRVIFEDGETPYHLLVGVPVHAAPAVVRESGLTDETGWIPVDLQTLETGYQGIFAIGDITSIRQPNPSDLFLPKAGVFAEEQARVVARIISARLKGEGKPDKFAGKGLCYLEVGGGMAAYGQGDFYAWPEPSVFLKPPSQRFHKEREELEQELLRTLVGGSE